MARASNNGRENAETAKVPSEPEPRSAFVQSLSRGIDILRVVSDSDRPVSVGEIAQTLGINRSTASRLAATMRDRGLLAQQGAGGPYTLGLELLRFARAALREHPLAGVVTPVVDELVEQVLETASFAVGADTGVLYVYSRSYDRGLVRVSMTIGTVLPYSTSATGKALLAFSPPDRVGAVLETDTLPARTEQSLTDATRLRAELAEVHQRGYAVELGESNIAVGCVAVPVFGADRRPIGALSTSVTVNSLTERRIEELFSALKAAATRIERQFNQG